VTSKTEARLDRLYGRIGRQVPPLAGFLGWARRPSSRLVRLPVGAFLTVGGVFSILPILGLWMLPIGLMLLAVDVPPLQTPVAAVIIRGQRRLELRKRRRRKLKAAPSMTAPRP
jgi:hypothetical protein